MRIRLRWLLLLVFPALGQADPLQNVEVRLEPFPPLVHADGGGLAVDLLKLVAEDSDLEFSVQIMPYSRAKFQLRNGQTDLIGPIPVGMESREFYEYARELDWTFDTQADLYVLDRALLEPSALADLEIGVPLGNAEFFAELMDLPVSQFTESSLVNLVQMLARGRIDAVLFERASTFRTLGEQGVAGVYYQKLFSIPAGFAVRNDEQGNALGDGLDALLETVDHDRLLSAYHEYRTLPDSGEVNAAIRMLEARYSEVP